VFECGGSAKLGEFINDLFTCGEAVLTAL
jgi:hypothetical protein